MKADDIPGSVAVVTGGAQGIGAAIAERLSHSGANIVIADLDREAGQELATRLDGRFVHCDVQHFDDNKAVVDAAVQWFGKVDIVALNAGVSTGCGVGWDFSLPRYRRAMSVNVDGAVYGAQAAYEAMCGFGGDIIATASIAGLLPTPLDPVYGAGKHAVVGLVRALGPLWADRGIRVNALCPGFAETSIIDDIRPMLTETGIPVMDTDRVADAFVSVLTGDRTGQCWHVLPTLVNRPYDFADIPGLADIYPDPSSVQRS